MNALKNLRIGTRLGVGFGSMILLLALLTAVGFDRLAQMRSDVSVIADDRAPKVSAARDIAFLVMDEARVVRNLILILDKDQQAKNKEILAKDKSQIKEKLAWIESQLHSEKSKALFADIKAARADFVPFLDEVIDLAQQERRDDATTLLFGPRYKSQGVYLAALSALVSFQEDSMHEASAHAVATYEQSVQILLAVAVIATLTALVFGWFLTRTITQPLNQAVEAANRVAQGDLTQPIDHDHRDETGNLLDALASMQESLQSVVGNVRTSAEGVATASAEIAQGNLDLSSRTEEQASALEETAASMEELGATVRQNADNAQQANQLAKRASEVATAGGKVVSDVVGTMGAITESSRKIADIIGVIDSIAFQTNILALNAAVEAARAGEQGRGFAVVAAEVRTLAQRCAEAAKEIKELISVSVERVERGTTLADKAGITMEEIVGSIQRVSDIISEISSASNEQSAGVGQVGEAVSQMDKATQQNAALVEESAASAESLKHQAEQLVQTIAIFKIASR